jgi:hypothetical protein
MHVCAEYQVGRRQGWLGRTPTVTFLCSLSSDKHNSCGDGVVGDKKLEERSSSLTARGAQVPCSDLPLTQPFAVHAAWYYMELPHLQQLLDTSLYDIAEWCAGGPGH